jgi:hypothetical protein
MGAQAFSAIRKVVENTSTGMTMPRRGQAWGFDCNQLSAILLRPRDERRAQHKRLGVMREENDLDETCQIEMKFAVVMYKHVFQETRP